MVEGDEARGTLTVVNTGNGRSPPLVASESVAGKNVRVNVPSLAPHASYTDSYRLPTARRGCYQVGPLTVSSSDPLRLLAVDNVSGGEGHLWVHPRTDRVRPLPLGRWQEFDGPTTASAPRGGVAFHSLREYVAGDDLRLIHWRSTAKTGALMVRHTVVTNEPEMMIVLDTSASAYTGEDFEQAVRIVASLTIAGVDRRFPVDLFTTNGLRGRIDQSGSGRVSVFDQLSIVEPRDGDPGLNALAVFAPARATRHRARNRHRSDLGGRSNADRHRPPPLQHRHRHSGGTDHGRTEGKCRRCHVRVCCGCTRIRRAMEGSSVMSQLRRLMRQAIRYPDLWLFALATLIALTPFHRALVGWSFAGPIVAAVFGPAAISVATARRRLMVSVVSLVLISTAVLIVAVYPQTTQYGLPLGRTWSAVGHGATSWWRDFLTTAVPSKPSEHLLAAPVVLALLGSSLMSQITIRTRWSLVPAVIPLVVLGAATSFSPSSSMLDAFSCLVFAFVVLCGVVARSHVRRGVTGVPQRSALRDAAVWLTLGSLSLAASIGVGLGVAQGFVHDDDRFSARDLIDPPVDLHDEVTPLALFRLKKGDTPDERMFTVTLDRLPAGADAAGVVIPLAYLTSYDGSAWTVDEHEFELAGSSLPRPIGIRSRTGDTIKQHYELSAGLDTSFIPSMPSATSIESSGFAVAFSARTGTLLRTSSRPAGAVYDVTSVVRTATPSSCAAGVPAAADPPGLHPPQLAPLREIPGDMFSLGQFQVINEWAHEDSTNPMVGLRTLECEMRLYGNNAAARPGHNLKRLAEAITSKVGSEEQYSSAFALAARINGLPSRVVVGFELQPSEVTAGTPVIVTAKQLSAWPEVYVGGEVGWQSFDISGVETNVADQTAAEVDAEAASGEPQSTPTTQPEEQSGPPEPSALYQAKGRAISFLLPLALVILVGLALCGIVARKRMLRARRASTRDPRRWSPGLGRKYGSGFDRSAFPRCGR